MPPPSNDKNAPCADLEPLKIDSPANTPIARKWLLLWGVSFILAFGILCWAPAIYDDIAYIFKNPFVTGPWPGFQPFINISTYRGHPTEAPAVYILHWLLYRIGAKNILLYHLTSLALHAANSIFVWRIYRRLLKREDLALWAAVLFSLFPTHVEALVISTYKTHLIVSFCALLILNLQAQNIRSFWRSAGCWIAMLLAVLFKESAVFIPFIALLADIAHSGVQGARKRNTTLHAGLFVIMAVYLNCRLFSMPIQHHVSSVMAGHGIAHLATIGKMFLWYHLHLILPTNVSLEHSLSPVTSLAQASLVLTTVIALLAASFKLFRWDKIAWTGWALITLSLGPFILTPYERINMVSDRYVYFAAAGFFLWLGATVGRLSESLGPPARRRVYLGLAVLSAFYGGANLRYGGLFSDPVALWKDAIRCAPTNPRARNLLSAAYRDRGLLAEALAEQLHGLKLAPITGAYLSLGVTYFRMGRLDDAIAATKTAVSIQPDFEGYSNLGTFLIGAGRFEEALQPTRRAAELEPVTTKSYYNLGICYLGMRKWDEALAAFKRAIKTPEHTVTGLIKMSDAFEGKGDVRRSIGFDEAARRLNPADAQLSLRLARKYVAAGNATKAMSIYNGLLDDLESDLATVKSRPNDIFGPSQGTIENILKELTRERDRAVALRTKRRSS